MRNRDFVIGILCIDSIMKALSSYLNVNDLVILNATVECFLLPQGTLCFTNASCLYNILSVSGIILYS